MLKLRPYQDNGNKQILQAFTEPNVKAVVCTVPTGGGKCLAKGTGIIMYDGSIKNVEHINRNEIIMGPDSTPRTVLSTTSGNEMMYRITLKNGDSFECNESHILSLVCNSTVTRKFIKDQVYDLSILEYLALPNHIKHVLKSYKVGIELPEQDIVIDPYFMGVWLGDGDSKGPTITNMDIEIEKYLVEYAKKISHKVSKAPNGNTRAFRYCISPIKSGWNKGILQALRNENLINNKHIPEKYLKNSRAIRLKLLAGLIDTDGHFHHNSYEIATCNKQLSIDICWLARSLGFNVNCNRNSADNAYRINISGHTNEIPVLIERKKAVPRKQIKNVNRYAFTIEKLEVDEYFGFEIDGDRRFVLSDFTVTHNTVQFAGLTHDFIKRGIHVLILCNRIELIDQAHAKLKYNGLHPKLIIPGYKDTVTNLYLGSVDTLRNYRLPDVGLVIIDECHIRDFDEIVLEYKSRGVKVVGFTATPVRTGKRLLKHDSLLSMHYPMYTGQMGDVYDSLVVPITITELLQGCSEGYTYLVPEVTYSAYVDVSKFKVKNTKDGEDFSEADQLKYFNTPQLYGGTVDKYIKHANGTKAICYCVNVAQSIKQCEEFNARGIPAVHIDGSAALKKHRRQIFKDFEEGKYKVLCNVAVATTGNDIPSVETIIMNRITKSLSLFLQIAGRGARLCPEIGKKYFNFIDMGGNIYRFGFWHEEREWSLDVEFMSRSKGVAPIRECDKCEALIPASASSCQYCGMIQEKKKQTEKEIKELAQAEFGIVDSSAIPAILKKPLHEMTIDQLEQYRELKGNSIGWIARQLAYRGDSALYEYARLKNYSSAWVRKQKEIVNNAKEQATTTIWEFIQMNTHCDEEYIRSYSIKKLKGSHSALEIEAIMPKILAAFNELKKEVISKVNSNK